MPDYTAGKARILLEPTARGFFAKARGELRKDLGSGNRIEQPVVLTPSTTRFRETAVDQLKTIREIWHPVTIRPNIPNRNLFRADAKAQAETHLEGLYTTMQVRGVVDMTYANTQLRAWRLKEEANPLRIKVITEHVGGVGRPAGNVIRNVPGPGGGGQILQPSHTFAFGHNVPILKPKVDEAHVAAEGKKTKDAIEKAGKKAKIKPSIEIDSTLKRLKKEFDDALKPKRVIGPSFRGVELLQPSILGLASQGLPMLTQALGQVIGALNQLGGAALAIPGALAVVGSSIGTLTLGISGMGDAFKALTQEQERSASQASSDAARFESAQNQMRNALVDQRRAQDDLTRARKDARRELEDLHDEERSSYLSVAEAALDLQEARNELAKGRFEGPLDRDRAVIRELRAREGLKEALQRQGRAREDVTEADKKGISSSDRVTAAQEAMVRSNQQVAQSLTALKNESSGAANAQDKVRAQLEKLSPAARDAVLTLFDLKDKAFIPLRNVASQNIFENFSRNIRALVDADLPALQKGVAGIGTGINRNLTQAMASLRTPGTQSVLERIFGNTEEFHKRLTRAIDPAIRGLGTLAAAGSDTMPRMATGLAKLTERFAGFIEKADREGRLDQWIGGGIEGLASLGRSFGNILTSLHEIGEAFGGGLLDTVERLTKRMADFFASAKGKNTIGDLIRTVRRDLEDWRPVLQDMPRMFQGMMQGARNTMHVIMPLINAITSALDRWPGLAAGIASAFIAWRFLRPVFKIVSTALDGIDTGLGRLQNKIRPTNAAIAGIGTTTKRVQTAQIAPAITGMASGFQSLRVHANNAATNVGAAMGRMGGFIQRNGVKAVGGLRTAIAGIGTTTKLVQTGQITPAITGIASGFQSLRVHASNAATNVGTAMGRMGGFIQRNGVKAIGGLRTALASTATFLGGPWGAVVGIAAVAALGALADAHDGAKEAADQQRRVVDQLKGSLDNVTQAAGAATRAMLGEEMEDFQPEHGLTGNVRQAVEGLGVPRSDFLRAILPGGTERAKEFFDQFQEIARPAILNAVPTEISDLLHAAGIDDNTIIKAFMGDQESVKRIREETTGVRATRYYGWDLGNLQEDFRGSAGQREQAAVLGAQFLQNKMPGIATAQTQAREAQVTAAGGTPTLTPEGKRIFGSGARPFWDDNTGAVEIDGKLQKAQVDALEKRGSTVNYDAFADMTTVTLSDDDRQALMTIPTPTRREGGPSPEAGMRGPTGGVMTELHGHEWILPDHARTRLGDEWLWEQTRNKAVKRDGKGYWWGGPFPLTPPTPGLPAPAPTPAVDVAATPPGVNVPQGTGPLPGPSLGALQPGSSTDAQLGVSHAGGPGVSLDDASALLNQPAPEIGSGGLQDQQTPDIGRSFANMFLSPWGFQMGADGQPTPMGGRGADRDKGPGQWLGEWGGQFITSLGETLINGVLGFFGMSTDNVYFNALKKTLGFYSGKLGGATGGLGQSVDPATQSLVDSSVAGYTTLVDPASGTTYLVPNDGSDAGGGSGDSGLPDLSGLPASTRLKDTGKTPSGPQVQRAAALIEQKWGQLLRKDFGGSRDTNTVKGTHDTGTSIDIPIDGDQKEVGDAIASYFRGNADALGVEYVLWQQKGHFDHIDIHFNGKTPANMPDADQGWFPPDLGGDGGTGIPSVADIPSAPGTAPAPTPQERVKRHLPGFAGDLANIFGAGPGGSQPGVLGQTPSSQRRSDLLLPSDQPGGASENIPGGSIGPGGQLMPGTGLGRKVVVIPGNGRRSGGFFNAALLRIARGNKGAAAGAPRVAAPTSNSRKDVAQYVYRAALSRGFSKREALAIVAYAEGESGLNPGISGGSQAAGGGAGGAADVVIGLFQEKPAFAIGGGVDPAARFTVEGNTTAYLNQLAKHRGTGDIYDQLLATSVGGPMYTGGRSAMRGLEERVLPLLSYDRGGMLRRGLSLLQHNKATPDVMVPGAIARQTVAKLAAVTAPPAPRPPKEMDIPQAHKRLEEAHLMRPVAPTPTPGPPAAQMRPPPPAAPPPAAAAPTPTQPPQATPAEPTPAAKPVGPYEDKEFLLPAISKGIQSTTDVIANAAEMAAAVGSMGASGGAAAMGGGLGGLGGGGGGGGPSVSGLIKQGGKMVTDAAEVAAAFASGFTKFGGTTPNPYGVQLRRQDQPPPLAGDNRRVHNGNNYFASMDEWRRQNQLQDAQDMQAGMARIK